MTQIKTNGIFRILVHCVGLACLGVVLYMEGLAFFDLLQYGYYIIYERNPTNLTVRFAAIALATIYFIYLLRRIIKSTKAQHFPSLQEDN